MSKEKQYARYLQDKEGNVRLYRGEDIEAALVQGLKEPTGLKPNGEPWNPEPIEGETPQSEFIVRHLDANAVTNDKRAAKKAEAEEAQRKANEAAAEAVESEPDFKVEIVEPKKASPAAAKSK